MSSFFLALTFQSQTPWAKKVDQFRRRFDPKYPVNSKLYISLLPPFHLVREKETSFIELLRDEVDNYLLGLNFEQGMEFEGLDVHTSKRALLTMTPKLSEDLKHCQEGLDGIIGESHGLYSKNYSAEKRRYLTFLTLARFHHSSGVHLALELAIRDFNFPLSLVPDSLVLFKKQDHHWSIYCSLYDFEWEKSLGNQKIYNLASS